MMFFTVAPSKKLNELLKVTLIMVYTVQCKYFVGYKFHQEWFHRFVKILISQIANII